MPRFSNVRSLIAVGFGELTLPAQIDVAQPAGLNDGFASSLSMDANGNCRVTLNGASLPGGTILPVNNQNGIADTLAATGAATAPGAGAAIVTLAIPTAGVYDVTVIAALPLGTPVAADLTNMQFRNNAVAVALVFTDAQQTPFKRVTVSGAVNLTVNAVAAGTAGVTYLATISATRLS